MLDEMANILRQLMPEYFKDLYCKDTEDILYCAAMGFIGLETNDQVDLLPFYDRGVNIDSLEYVEEAYKRGWAAIVHDGKVVGYKKEVG